MGGGFQEKPVNMLGDAGCARRFQRRAIFALGLCCTMGLMSPLARTDPARNGGRSVAQLADHFSRERLVLVTRRQSRRRDPIAAAALARSVHDRGQTVDFQRRGLPRIALARACFEGAQAVNRRTSRCRRAGMRAGAVGTAPTVQRDGAEAWPAGAAFLAIKIYFNRFCGR